MTPLAEVPPCRSCSSSWWPSWSSWPAPAPVRGEPLTLDEAIRLAVRESARGRIIRGDVEVKQGLYQASRSNFYFPSVSINGQVPSYSVDQSYKFFGGSTRKRLYKTQGLELNSFIQLEQSLAHRRHAEPAGQPGEQPGPLSRHRSDGLARTPSSTRSAGAATSTSRSRSRSCVPRSRAMSWPTARTISRQARLTRVSEEAKLAREVTEAFVGVILADLKAETARDRLEAAGLQAEIDSTEVDRRRALGGGVADLGVEAARRGAEPARGDRGGGRAAAVPGAAAGPRGRAGDRACASRAAPGAPGRSGSTALRAGWSTTPGRAAGGAGARQGDPRRRRSRPPGTASPGDLKAELLHRAGAREARESPRGQHQHQRLGQFR